MAGLNRILTLRACMQRIPNITIKTFAMPFMPVAITEGILSTSCKSACILATPLMTKMSILAVFIDLTFRLGFH